MRSDVQYPLRGITAPVISPRGFTLRRLLFGTSNATGFTFEPWDITTLYQDRAGTTPVTDVGQSVGLRLSKDKGLALGPELVTNGAFGANITGWSNTGASISVWESGAARWSTATAEFSGFRSASFATVVGRTYEFTATVLENTGSAWRIVFVNGDGSFSNGTDNYTTPGTRTARFIATQTTSFVEIRNGTAATANRLIDNISVRELAGNHEVAINDAARGVYGREPIGGTRNRMTYTEQFDNAAWTKSAATVTANAAVAPDGTTTADTITPNTSAGQFHLASWAATLAGQSVVSVYAKPSGYDKLAISVQFANSATFDLTLGMVISGGSAASIQSVGNGWFRCSYSLTRSGGSNIEIGVARQTDGAWAGWTANGTDGILIWGAQLELGSTATAYQRVVSQYDITEAGVPTCYYVQTDGFDDAYVTPTITPGTDKAQVFAGVRKNSDAAIGMVVEYSATIASNNGAFYIAAPITAGAANYHFVSKGTGPVSATYTNAAVAAPATNVITALGDISGDRATLRINGVQVAQSTADQGTGNYLAYPAYIYGRGGTSLPFNGRDYGHVIRFGPNLDAATIARVEALIARNTPTVML